MRKVFKNISAIFLTSILASSSALFFSSCQSSKQEPKKEEKSDFIGFKNDKMSYQDRDGVKQDVPIVKQSSKLYRTSHPLDYFDTAQTYQLFEFTIEVTSGDISTRARYYLDDSISHHGLRLLNHSEGAYISEMPIITVSDVSVRTESVYVNFECDPEVLFIIDVNLWASLEEDTKFIYYKTDPLDPKYLIPSSNYFTTCFLCPRNKTTTDFEDSTDIICRKGDYQKINHEFDVSVTDSTSYNINHMFDGALNFSYYVKKDVDTFGEYYKIHFDYTFFGGITPSEAEVSSKFTNVAYLNAYTVHEDKRALTAVCAFCICWI